MRWIFIYAHYYVNIIELDNFVRMFVEVYFRLLLSLAGFSCMVPFLAVWNQTEFRLISNQSGGLTRSEFASIWYDTEFHFSR